VQRFCPLPLQVRRRGEPPDRRHEIGCFALEAFGQLVQRALVIAGIGDEPSALDEQFIEAAASE
jgi:hypothetical protein